MKRLKVDLDKEIFHKTIYEMEVEKWDEYGTDEEKYKFGFYFRLSKVYTLKGVVYRVEVPNRTAHDKNLGRLMAETMLYIHDNGMRYERLKQVLESKDLWRGL